MQPFRASKEVCVCNCILIDNLVYWIQAHPLVRNFDSNCTIIKNTGDMPQAALICVTVYRIFRRQSKGLATKSTYFVRYIYFQMRWFIQEQFPSHAKLSFQEFVNQLTIYLKTNMLFPICLILHFSRFVDALKVR